VAFKTIAETVDSSASVEIGPERTEIVLPDDFEMPPGGVNIRWPDQPLDQEFRLHKYKLYAALAFARSNRLDRIVIDSPRPRFGIVTTGKSYLDVRQALDDPGPSNARASGILPRGSRKSSSSRKNAPSSRTSLRSSSTIGVKTFARASSASSTKTATGYCRRTAS
jgi:hypothetical protein